jgi:hypothetical protein
VIRRLLTISLVLGACVAMDGHAGIRVDNIANMDFGTWDPSAGNVSRTSDFCVISVQGNVNSSTPITPYAAMVENRDAAAYELDPVGVGSDVIAVTVTFVDLVSSGSETLTPDVFTSQTKTGAVGTPSNCPSGLNARIRIDISGSDLSRVVAGNYRGRFSFTAQGGNGSETRTKNFTIDVTLPDLVRISQMDDLDLGTYDGINDSTGTDFICVYRNGLSGAYNIAAQGDGAANAFEIADGSNALSYQVEYDDGTGFVILTAAGAPLNRANADPNATDCGGVSNAQVRVTVFAIDMDAVPVGNYAGTLTLTVAPI